MTWVVKAIDAYQKSDKTEPNQLLECYWIVCTVSEAVQDHQQVIAIIFASNI